MNVRELLIKFLHLIKPTQPAPPQKINHAVILKPNNLLNIKINQKLSLGTTGNY